MKKTCLIVAGVHIDKHHLHVTVVVLALIVVGELGVAGGEDSLSGFAAAVEIAVLDLHGFWLIL